MILKYICEDTQKQRHQKCDVRSKVGRNKSGIDTNPNKKVFDILTKQKLLIEK